MAHRRVTRSYATAYSFGTDGSAALAGSPIASHRPLAVQATRMKRQGIAIPRWALIGALVLMAVVLIASFSGVRDQQTFLTREAQRQRTIISGSLAKIDELDARLAEAGDEARIRRIASNRMGMHPPTAEQVYPVPVPQVLVARPDGLPSTDNISVLDMIRGTKGQ